MLDAAAKDPIFAGVFVFLQIQVLSGAGALQRLRQALAADHISAAEFSHLIYAGLHRAFDDDALASVIDVLLTRPGGPQVALGILEMRMLEQGRDAPAGRLMESCCDALSRYDFRTTADSMGVTASRLAASVLATERTDVAKALCRSFVAWAKGNAAWICERNEILEALFRQAPNVTLTELLLRSPEARERLADAKRFASWTPVVALSVEAAVEWAGQEPSRFAALAEVVPLFLIDRFDKASGLNPLAVELIRNSPNKALVLDAFERDLRISGGLVSEIPLEIERRQKLLASLADGADAEVADWSAKAARELGSQVSYWANWAQERHERFE
ncbi:MAG: hypothetical protein KatS3mg116_3710 [Elioraea sp.]|nr:MAG: hypothetical protein KatS3mg116_3710 [Elioraea sp.]